MYISLHQFIGYQIFNITNVIVQSNFITVSIGYEEGKKRQYPMVSDTKAWARKLKDHFPNEHKAIDEFVRVMKEYGKGFDDCCGLVKLLPLPLANFLIKIRFFDLINKKWANSGSETTKDVIER